MCVCVYSRSCLSNIKYNEEICVLAFFGNNPAPPLFEVYNRTEKCRSTHWPPPKRNKKLGRCKDAESNKGFKAQKRDLCWDEECWLTSQKSDDGLNLLGKQTQFLLNTDCVCIWSSLSCICAPYRSGTGPPWWIFGHREERKVDPALLPYHPENKFSICALGQLYFHFISISSVALPCF